MKPRERVLAVLRGERPDRVPLTVYECMIPQCAVERRLRNDGLCIVNRHHRAYRVETPNCTRQTLRYTEGGRNRTRTTISTPVGDVSTVVEPAGNREPFYTEWTIEHYFKGPEDYAPLRFLAEDESYSPAYEDAERARRWMGDDILLRGTLGANPLHRIMQWMGLERFAVEWHERRDEVLRLESVMRRGKRKLYQIVADSPLTHANYGGNEVPEVMGLERYEQFVLPLLQESAEVLHAGGKLVGSHLDGNNSAWAHLVAQSGLHYVEAFTPAPDTDMTLEQALDAWPDKVLWINFPSSLHLAPVERIEQVTRRFVELGRQTNRVIIGITEDIPPDRWQQNLLAISRVINSDVS
ncbi:MAG: uroporphyrinogen decarboxylase family protein [Candidatus Brocadiia bacterium]